MVKSDIRSSESEFGYGSRRRGSDLGVGARDVTESGKNIPTEVPAIRAVTGIKLQAMTQKLAYRVIRNRKEEQTTERRATKENMTKIVNKAEEAYGVRMKPRMMWRSLTNRHVSKECRQYWWKALHNAFMVGRHWLRPKMPDNLKARMTCARCGVLESMEHILLKCEETERET